MSFIKKLVFALIPVFLLIGIIEITARIYWHNLEQKTIKKIEKTAENLLMTDPVHFTKEIHPILGYHLKPNLKLSEHFKTNKAGFFQEEEVDLVKKPNSLRIMAIGESTTQGMSLSANYPTKLKKFLEPYNNRFSGGIEVINTGVAGWISDQWTLASQIKFANYNPDIVIFYCGWNDFQSYDPINSPPKISYFDTYYGKIGKFLHYQPLKSIFILRILYQKYFSKGSKVVALKETNNSLVQTKETYKFFFQNLTNAIQFFKQQNPKVIIIISSLVGKWPMNSEEDSKHTIWWMKNHHVSKYKAADLLVKYNKLIEEYTSLNNHYFIDMHKVFSKLNRNVLLSDFAHMTNKGYEIMGKTFADFIINKTLSLI